MGEIKEKYIGESPIKDKPKNKLKLIIGDNVIKGNNIADDAIGNDKLKDNTIEGRNIAPGAINISKIAPGTLDGKEIVMNSNLMAIETEDNGDIVAYYGKAESTDRLEMEENGDISFVREV